MLEAITLLPFVPGGPDFAKSRALFREIGFEETWSSDEYVGFRSGGAQFILQDFDNAAFASNFMVRIDVPDLDAWWEQIVAKDLAARFPGMKLKPPAVFPWGREVHFIDLAGVCWHVGAA